MSIIELSGEELSVKDPETKTKKNKTQKKKEKKEAGISQDELNNFKHNFGKAYNSS